MESEALQSCLHQVQEEGDTKAFRALYDFLSPRIYFVCLRYMKDQEDAQEVLQLTFITVFEKIKQFKREGSFEGWVKRIAVNTALQHLRKAKKTLWLDDVAEVPMEDESMEIEVFEEVDNAAVVMQLLNTMPDGYRTILNLSVLEGYSHKEIGEMLDISEGTSRSQLLRAKKKLKEMVLAFNAGDQKKYRPITTG